MENIARIDQITISGAASGHEMMQIFDQAEPISCDFMYGQWKGLEIKTGHPMEGLLEISRWYGKVFKDLEQVYPLVFLDADGQTLFAGDPKHVPLNQHVAIFKKAGKLLPIATKIFKTKDSKARLRMMEYRGVSSATMIYDEKPINDHFRKIDENRVLGLMDLKSIPQPYFFMLERDDQAHYDIDL